MNHTFTANTGLHLQEHVLGLMHDLLKRGCSCLPLFSFQWDLVCDRKWMAKTVGSVYLFGILAGSAFTGQISDR